MNIVNNKNAQVLDSKFEKYDVSVCIIAYNVSKYIETAINSVLEQNTDCSYEIVVGDNSSQDDTPQILRRYWESQPDKFCIILNDKNLGLSTNMYNVLCKAKGKYIIILYGDDYWIDKNRLQEQFDFLENSKQYFGVTMPIISIVDGEKEGKTIYPPRKLQKKSYTLDMYLRGYDFPMAGLMFKNDVFSGNLEHFYNMVKAHKDIDDASFCILALMMGNIYVLGRATGAYRVFNNNNAQNFNTVNTLAMRCEKSINLYNNFEKLAANKIDLGMRFGLVLTSAFYGLFRHRISLKDYFALVRTIDKRYRSKHIRMLIRGIYRKVSIKLSQKKDSIALQK